MSTPLGPGYEIVGSNASDTLGLLNIIPLNSNDLQISLYNHLGSSKSPFNATTTFTNSSVTMDLTYTEPRSSSQEAEITNGILNINNVKTPIEKDGIVRNVGWKWLSNIYSWDVSGALSGKANILVVWNPDSSVQFGLSKSNKGRMGMAVSSSTKVSSPINGSFTIASQLKGKSYVIEVQNSRVTKANLWDTFSFIGASVSIDMDNTSWILGLYIDSCSGTVPLLDIIEISEFNESHK